MTDKRIIFIATYYGLNSQTTKTIEELAELVKALAKPQSLPGYEIRMKVTRRRQRKKR